MSSGVLEQGGASFAQGAGERPDEHPRVDGMVADEFVAGRDGR
ncbi:MAG: hypothetical protein ACKPDI_09920 [Actinomycetota bacterium]